MSVQIDLARAIYPNLKDHRVVIAGGTGDVGEGVVRSWLKTGAGVIVPSRTESTVARFKDLLAGTDGMDRLHFAVGDYTGFDEAQAMADRITTEYGPVTDVVASIGGWWQGKPLWDVSTEEWQRYFVTMSTAHAATARAWLPRLPATGSYQLVLGGSAVHPVPGASIISMQQAALLMMRRVLSTEAGGTPRVAAQILGPVVTRSRRRIDPDWVANEEVGLVSAAIAADAGLSGEDLTSFDKAEMLKNLQRLGAYPTHVECALVASSKTENTRQREVRKSNVSKSSL